MRRVAPADAGRVLLVGELGVVQQQVGAARDCEPGFGLEPGLVVGDEGEGCSVLHEPVRERRPGVAHTGRRDAQAVDVPRFVFDLLEADVSRRSARTARGKYGGDRYAAIFSLSVPFAGRGPWILIVDSGSKSSAKKPSPSMWSRCRCVSSRSISWSDSSASARPRFRMPVPASMTTTAPSALRTSRHVVLPP